MTSEFMARFSDEELDQCQSWLLPDVSSSPLLPSAEKEKTDRKKNPSAEFSREAAPDKATIDKKQSDKKAPVIDGEIIEDVTAESITVQPLTADQLQEITEAAEKEGYDAGYQQGLTEGEAAGKITGKEQGLQQGRQLIAEHSERLQHLIEALLIPLESEQKIIEDMMLNMVCQLTKAVIHKELQIDSSHITQLITDAINSLPKTTEKFTLYLNSQDSELVQQHLQTTDKDALYHIDDTLLPGGCRLATQHSSIDLTVETRMQEVIDGFLNKRFVNTHPLEKKQDKREVGGESENKHENQYENKDATAAKTTR